MKPLLKISKVNYNNILEKVLETKDFSAITKSLLLSMLYKIETAYDDYVKVKVMVKTKEKLIEDIIETIDKKCVLIKLVEPNSDIGLKMQEHNINSFIENKTDLVCFPTEVSLFSGIILLMKKNFFIRPLYRMISFVIEDFFRIAYSNNLKECILNFDGWSWNSQDISEDEMLYNIVFYNFVDLATLELIEEWKESNNTNDYIEIFTKKLIEKFGEDNAHRTLILFYRLFLKILIKDYRNDVYEILEEGKKIKEAIEYMEDKPRYLQDIYDKKKTINDRIKEIETMMLNKEELKEKYNEVNNALPLDKQIFSIRHFSTKIRQERENLYNEIKQYNSKLAPRKYLQEKNELEKKYIKFVDIQKMQKSKSTLKTEVINLQKKILELKELEISKIDNKKDLINNIFILRYYKNLKSSKNSYIKTEKALKNTLLNYERKLISKACKLHVFTKLSDNNLQNIQILSAILDTKIINLVDIQILPRIERNRIILDIYDGEVLESSFKLDENIKELALKPNKKIKIFS